MSLSSKDRSEILNRIKIGCRQAKLDDETVPRTWADRVGIQVPVVPTPSARLNAALGIGGVPLGRILEIYGTESSGKTTLALELIAAAQKMGLATGFLDMEHALDASYAKALGVDMDDLFISQPSDGNQCLELAKIMIMSGIKLIIMDSVPALVNKDEYEKDITDAHVGLQARMMGQTVRQLAPLLSRAGSTIIFINQIREKIGVMYGNPETTPGGRAIKFFASQRIEMRAQSMKDRAGERRTTRIKVVKNKLDSPFKECEVDILFGKGFDRLSDTVHFAKELEIIKGKSWMVLPKLDEQNIKYPEGEIKFQGIEAVMAFVESTPGYLDVLKNECQRVYRLSRASVGQVEQEYLEAPDVPVAEDFETNEP